MKSPTDPDNISQEILYIIFQVYKQLLALLENSLGVLSQSRTNPFQS